MPWGVAAGVIGAGASLYGASQQASAAKGAAGSQEAASEAQLGLDANVFNATAVMQQPTRELGGLAQSRLAYLMGLSPNLDISADFSNPNINPNPGSGPGLTWNGQGSGYSSYNTGAGNPNAPSLQPTTYNGLNTNYGTTTGGSQDPGTGAPASATGGFGSTTSPTLGGFGSLGNPYDPSTFYEDPGYKFVMDQQQSALARAGASSGQLGTGAQLKAAMTYAEGLGSQEFNNAFSRSQSTQTTMFNELSALSGAGQVATGAVGSAAGNLATGGSSALAGYGNAQAAGQIGAGNAYGSALNQINNSATTLGTQYFKSQQSPSGGMNNYTIPTVPDMSDQYNPSGGFGQTNFSTAPVPSVS